VRGRKEGKKRRRKEGKKESNSLEAEWVSFGLMALKVYNGWMDGTFISKSSIFSCVANY
jgi:hypothetical protein